VIRANFLDQFVVIPAGLADENKCLGLYRKSGSTEDAAATIRQNLRPARESEVEFIPCFKFDELRHSLSVKEISFIKIDVEGAELEVLVGMRKSLQECRPIVLCEVLFADKNADLEQHEHRNNRLARVLRELDYRIFQLIKSSNKEDIIGVKQIEKFTSVYWTTQNEDLCDYLFLPQESASGALKALLRSGFNDVVGLIS